MANSIKPDVGADMVDAADGLIIFIILGTQPWIFKNWLNHVPNSVAPPTHTSGEGTSEDQRHEAFLRRVSEYPSVIDISSMQGSRQTPRLRALSSALGFATDDPFTRYHEPGELEKRATITKSYLEHRPHSLADHDIVDGSRPSLKNIEYGVALGHPSRDASATGSLRPAAGTPTEGRAASLVIISTHSEVSSHALHLPLDEDAQASERPRRTSLSLLATAGLNQSQNRSRRASDGSLPHTSWVSLERSRRGYDSPLRASYVGASMEQEGSGVSARTSRSVRTSLEPAPSALSPTTRRHHGYEQSNGEMSSMYQTASDSSGHILGDEFASSVQSWPDISRSTLQLPQDHAEDNATSASGRFSGSSLALEPRWAQHFGDTPEQPPHPAFLRENTPSPFLLNDEGSTGTHNTFGGGPSPVERCYHPYTRGSSPLRPPGLGSPLRRWTEQIEETKNVSNQP